jgi:hypothetical protein
MKSIETLKGATVEFFTMESYDGKNIAENIIITEQPSLPNPNNLLGKTLTERLRMLQILEFSFVCKVLRTDYCIRIVYPII